MIPPCPTCNGTGLSIPDEPEFDVDEYPCPVPGPTLLDRDGNPVHADVEKLVRWCVEHWLPTSTDEVCSDGPVLGPWHPLTRDRTPCDPGWATVQTWEEASDE